ncbi:hypothetical protein SAMN02745124_01791 [Desulfofustis glycolicus DSM 9705]|uniref:BNR repeat-containing family member n=2 Tax=Desulfofustis glycolicus TaxID=51195 RepID=A0A1M5VQ65_9BACT|nr:hypothetical protein SAMN02745124_01791 [Desulfofustis glycolicus DSM 9705]
MIYGRVIYVTRERVLAARGNRLIESLDGGVEWKQIGSLPVGFIEKSLMFFRLSSRLLRKGVHHFAVGESCALVSANRDVYSLESGQKRLLEPVHGSRPLTLCAVNGAFYYGEYRSNPERSTVHVWKLEEGEDKWQPVWRFEGIRHVHGVFHDSYENSIWVTTGDLDHEAGIWRTDDDFNTLEKIAGDSQQFRVVQLLFTKDHVYFGSDVPDDKNYIFRMDRNGNAVEKLMAVGSSVFYGYRVGNSLFFSTAVEPSRVNTTRYAEVWGSANGTDWKLIRKFKKDIWPMKYFQYGQVLFPAGPGDGENLWFTPFASAHDQKSFRIPLSTFATHHL